MTQEALRSAPYARQRPARWVTGRRARVLLCASGVSFMIMLNSNIVAVSLPSIARDLNATFADIEWVVSAYVLTFAALLMPSGALADRYGRRRMLTLGLAIFTLASLMCGLAPSALFLNSARALQGVGAAIELSAALAVLGHAFQGAERAKAFDLGNGRRNRRRRGSPHRRPDHLDIRLALGVPCEHSLRRGAHLARSRRYRKVRAIRMRRDWTRWGCCRSAADSSVSSGR